MRRAGLLTIALACLGGGAWWLASAGEKRPATPRPVPSAAPADDALEQLAPGSTDVVVVDAHVAPAASAMHATLGWGRCPACLGKPTEGEGHGETPLRLAVDSAGGTLLLDGERAVRLGPDGEPAGTLALPFAPRDLTTGKNGDVYLLDPSHANVTVLDARGRPRATLPIPESVAETSRRVVVQGDDVYVESLRGEYVLVGTQAGAALHPDVVAGIPMRDGRGWLSVRIVDAAGGGIHVLVVERPGEAQRFSRLLKPSFPAEGLFLVDTSADGTIYLGVAGTSVAEAQLLCLDAAHGAVLGVADVALSETETVLDGKALDAGGVVLSVNTSAGVRVERLDCHGA